MQDIIELSSNFLITFDYAGLRYNDNAQYLTRTVVFIGRYQTMAIGGNMETLLIKITVSNMDRLLYDLLSTFTKLFL